MEDAIRITRLDVCVASTSFRNLVLVKVGTDAGITGWGDASLIMREQAVVPHVEFLARILRGADALAPADIWRRVVEEDFFMRSDIVGRSAVAGVMVACMDIAGKAYNVPVYRLLGGPVRDRIPAYANGWYRGDRTPATYAELARQVVASGHRALKLDPFGTAGMLAHRSEVREGIGLVAAVRDAVGPEIELYVDAHGRFTPATAREMLGQLAELQVGFIEEPIAPGDALGLRALRQISPIPIAAGERCVSRFEFRALIENDAVDIIQPDITWAGGLLEVQRIASWAEVHQMVLATHNANSPLATAAGCHLAASIPNFLRQEMFEDFDEPWVRDAFRGALTIDDGHLVLPTGTGLGIEPDERALSEHPFRPVFLNFSDEKWSTFEAVLGE